MEFVKVSLPLEHGPILCSLLQMLLPIRLLYLAQRLYVVVVLPNKLTLWLALVDFNSFEHFSKLF